MCLIQSVSPLFILHSFFLYAVWIIQLSVPLALPHKHARVIHSFEETVIRWGMSCESFMSRQGWGGVCINQSIRYSAYWARDWYEIENETAGQDWTGRVSRNGRNRWCEVGPITYNEVGDVFQCSRGAVWFVEVNKYSNIVIGGAIFCRSSSERTWAFMLWLCQYETKITRLRSWTILSYFLSADFLQH